MKKISIMKLNINIHDFKLLGSCAPCFSNESIDICSKHCTAMIERKVDQNELFKFSNRRPSSFIYVADGLPLENFGKLRGCDAHPIRLKHLFNRDRFNNRLCPSHAENRSFAST
jgi:hypothetical protein